MDVFFLYFFFPSLFKKNSGLERIRGRGTYIYHFYFKATHYKTVCQFWSQGAIWMLRSLLQAFLSMRKKKPRTNQTIVIVVADWIEEQRISGEVRASPAFFAEQEVSLSVPRLTWLRQLFSH